MILQDGGDSRSFFDDPSLVGNYDPGSGGFSTVPIAPAPASSGIIETPAPIVPADPISIFTFPVADAPPITSPTTPTAPFDFPAPYVVPSVPTLQPLLQAPSQPFTPSVSYPDQATIASGGSSTSTPNGSLGLLGTKPTDFGWPIIDWNPSVPTVKPFTLATPTNAPASSVTLLALAAVAALLLFNA